MDEDENSDVPSSVSEILPVLRDFQEKVPEIIAHVKRLQLVASDLDYSTKNGVSLLELKCHLLLDYLINLVFLMLNKMQGQLIAGTSPIDRLIELRVVLEKIRPLDHKFQYQIDKLIKAGAAATTTDDPLNFKPNPNNFIHKIQDVSSDEDESGRGTAVYVPPKVVATPYVEDTESKRTTRHHKNQPRLTTSTNLMEELRGEYSEAPQEFATAPSSLRRRRDLIEEKEQEEYEEEYFVRIGKRSNSKGTDHSSVSNLDEITQFRDPVLHKIKTSKTKRRKTLKKRLRRSRHRL